MTINICHNRNHTFHFLFEQKCVHLPKKKIFLLSNGQEQGAILVLYVVYCTIIAVSDKKGVSISMSTIHFDIHDSILMTAKVL